ncbi:MAG: hypothetical protein MUQ56_07995 [Thermoleophilia bacterium]|jgi:hypothetical protein|nr:hypothetical protein [Thermoleophilia bacterium]
MLWLQWGALLLGLVALLFFAVFTGYYFRNRRMAMEARRRTGPDAVTGEAGEAAAGRADGRGRSDRG